MELTPMMAQYRAIKSQYADAILFYRLGDFYEMFFDDATLASSLLDLTLTSRNKSQADSVPLCGVPFHSAQGYINKLLSLGHKVAICEQVEDPKVAKGLVKREVVRVLTPGLTLESESLEAGTPNYLLAVAMVNGRWGLAFCDISTGDLRVSEFDEPRKVADEILRLDPREVLLAQSSRSESWRQTLTPAMAGRRVSELSGFDFDVDHAREVCERYYSAAIEGLGLKSYPAGGTAVGAVIAYLDSSRYLKEKILQRPAFYSLAGALVLDESARRHLEIFKTSLDGKTEGTLFELLDETLTAPGSRLLRDWVLTPLADISAINLRLDAVDDLLAQRGLMQGLREQLKEVADLERLVNRAVAGVAHARDLCALGVSLKKVPSLKQLLTEARASLIKNLGCSLDEFADLSFEIERTLVEDPPLALKEGGLIASGVDVNLDELREIERNGKSFISNLEVRERERTQIPSLKIRFNRVFGYYIEITHTHRDRVPADYIRKQTLAAAERYLTPELKEYEDKVLGASERIKSLEYEIFTLLRNRVAVMAAEIKATAKALAHLDALASLAFVARELGYVRPQLVEEAVLEIIDGRHPVVERVHQDERFVPNDITMNPEAASLLIITGPNMAGKSTVMRQTALIVLLAHVGSFVPATRAVVGLTDRIFTRIGASDHLQKGQSTFMVEMLETAHILAHASPRSLIVLDEIGRGTSTFDGLSIAWATAETLAALRARTLFATHYHELTDLGADRPQIRNYHMAVKEVGGEIRFLRQIREGGTNRSYGVTVAAMAGLPPQTIKRAREILKLLEEKDLAFARESAGKNQFSLFEPQPSRVEEEIRALDVNGLTPLQALNILSRLKGELG